MMISSQAPPSEHARVADPGPADQVHAGSLVDMAGDTEIWLLGLDKASDRRRADAAPVGQPIDCGIEGGV